MREKVRRFKGVDREKREYTIIEEDFNTRIGRGKIGGGMVGTGGRGE